MSLTNYLGHLNLTRVVQKKEILVTYRHCPGDVTDAVAYLDRSSRDDLPEH